MKKQDLMSLSIGRYDIDGESYFNIQEYDTQTNIIPKFESHKEYIDVHLMICGREKIKVCDVQRLYSDIPYNSEIDTEFWRQTCAEFLVLDIVLEPGSYIVLYPVHAHVPANSVEGSIKVKKVVIKVKI